MDYKEGEKIATPIDYSKQKEQSVTDKQEDKSETVDGTDETFMKDTVKQTVNTVKQTVNPVISVTDTVAEFVNDITADENEYKEKEFKGFDFDESLDGRTKMFVRGSNITVTDSNKKDINFKVGVKATAGSYKFVMTVIGTSKEDFSKLLNDEQKQLVNIAKAGYIDRLNYDNPLRTKVLGTIYDSGNNLINNFDALKNKFQQDIDSLKEDFEQDYETYRILEEIADSYARPSEQRQAEFRLTKGMSTQSIINELYKLKEQGISTIYITREAGVDISKINSVVKLSSSYNMALNVNVDINIHNNEDIALLNNIKGIAGIRFSNIESMDDIKIIEKIYSSINNKIFSTVKPNISYSFVKENKEKKVYAKDQLPVADIESIINEIEKNAILSKGEFVIAYSSYINISKNLKEKLNKENRLIVDANTDEFNKLYGVLREGVSIIYRSVNRTIQSNVEKKYARGIEIGSNGFVKEFNIADVVSIINDDNLSLKNIDKKLNFLSEKGKFAVRYILEMENIEPNEKTEMIKALLNGMLSVTIEQLINNDLVSNDINDVLNILPPKDRKQIRNELLAAVSKQPNVASLNKQIKEASDGFKTAGTAEDVLKGLEDKLAEEKDPIVKVAIMLKLADILASEKNAEEMLKDTMNTSVEGIKDLLAAA